MQKKIITLKFGDDVEKQYFCTLKSVMRLKKSCHEDTARQREPEMIN